MRTSIMRSGVDLKPGTIGGSWFGEVNGHRFVLRRTVDRSRRMYQAFPLPAIPNAEPLATAATMEAVVAAVVQLYSIKLV